MTRQWKASLYRIAPDGFQHLQSLRSQAAYLYKAASNGFNVVVLHGFVDGLQTPNTSAIFPVPGDLEHLLQMDEQ